VVEDLRVFRHVGFFVSVVFNGRHLHAARKSVTIVTEVGRHFAPLRHRCSFEGDSSMATTTKHEASTHHQTAASSHEAANMINAASSDDIRTDFLCALTEGLASGRIPREKLKRLLRSYPSELQHRLQEDAKFVLLLEQVWRGRTLNSSSP